MTLATISDHPIIGNAPGLIWRSHKFGWEASWRARPDLVKRGYSPKWARLWIGAALTETDRETITGRCQRLQADMLKFSASPNAPRPNPSFAGKGRIYFVSDGRFVKIGFTTDYRLRLYNMQSANSADLETLAVIPGTPNDEKELHQRFGHLRIATGGREWFKPADDLMLFIAETAKATGH